ncbi:MAG: STAS domain-containing protein [Deltaproteobacteria bacterium]|nr:STAS domain-containing protein [Deltaproteobacteria bacterium]
MDVQRKDGVVVISIDERLDALAAPKLKETVKKMSEESSTKLVIDLAKTKFIDSSGCGALVASLRTLLKNQGDLKIARPSPQAQTLFQLTRLHRVFEIYDNLDAAIQSFV